MKLRLSLWACLAATAALGSCQTDSIPSTDREQNSARFDWLRYEGHDPVHGTEIDTETQFRNPILSGFYPDPSITQVGEDYYLVNSTFSYFPGIPVFHSTDLVSWTQIGNAIDRPGMLDFDGLGLSRGVFAPTIEHHEGTFYIANTCVDCGGNCILTASDPAGPWSDPIWLPQVGGIDPSLFFDRDGQVYILNNDGPVGEPRYDGHRAIWIRAVDPISFQSISEQTVLIDGGVRPDDNPIWIEGPHIYFKDGFYYLSAAEGGTALGHSQVILRSRSVNGPYTPYENNPIMTHRHLDPDRENPITSVGHADFVTDKDGQWWATFLGVRPYKGDFYNTGRETFLMPVKWDNGWPIILSKDEKIGSVEDRPNLSPAAPSNIPTSGNFIHTDDFNGAALPDYWMTPRVPKSSWYRMNAGHLEISPQKVSLGAMKQPSMIGRRQQHLYASATTKIDQIPIETATETGLTAFQNDDYFYAIGVSRSANGVRTLILRQKTGPDDPESGTIISSTELDSSIEFPLYLKIDAQGDQYRVSYSNDDETWVDLDDTLDGTILSTKIAGGFVGSLFGLYVQDLAAEEK
jgi:alpha-N-arabinofuranosidase